MRFGYASVSTDDQNLDLQQAALRAAGCTKVFEDRIAGAARKRLGLARALKACAGGGLPIAHLTPTLSPRKRAERELKWPSPPLAGGEGGVPARIRRGG
jgi:hypothetical protein